MSYERETPSQSRILWSAGRKIGLFTCAIHRLGAPADDMTRRLQIAHRQSPGIVSYDLADSDIRVGNVASVVVADKVPECKPFLAPRRHKDRRNSLDEKYTLEIADPISVKKLRHQMKRHLNASVCINVATPGDGTPLGQVDIAEQLHPTHSIFVS